MKRRLSCWMSGRLDREMVLRRQHCLLFHVVYDRTVPNADRYQQVCGNLLSPPVLMHGGLLCVAFRLSVRLSVTIPKVTR